MSNRNVLVLKAMILNVALAIGACASPNVHYRNYQHPEYGQAEFDLDWYACRKENEHMVTTVIGGVADVSPLVDERMAYACLNARGWRQAGAAPAPEQPEYSNTSSRPAATTTTTCKDAFADIRTAEDMQKHLDSWRQELDRAVASGKLTQEETDRVYQERKEYLTKRLSRCH